MYLVGEKSIGETRISLGAHSTPPEVADAASTRACFSVAVGAPAHVNSQRVDMLPRCVGLGGRAMGQRQLAADRHTRDGAVCQEPGDLGACAA